MASNGMGLEGDPFNTEMQFVTGDDRNAFTKTPANVTKDYFVGPAPPKAQIRSGGKNMAAKKRKAAANHGYDPATPAPKRAKGKVAATPGEAAEKAILSTLSVRPKQTRKFKGKNTAARPIPRTVEECDEADKMLLRWRDEAKEWVPIRAEWKRLTGEVTAPSTLPNRYARLKTNFAVIKEEDSAILIQAKREIEDSFQAQKWSLVAHVLHAKGGSDYTSCPVILQRQWKKLMLSGGAKIPVGLDDADFDLPILGSDAELDAELDEVGEEDEEEEEEEDDDHDDDEDEY